MDPRVICAHLFYIIYIFSGDTLFRLTYFHVHQVICTQPFFKQTFMLSLDVYNA